MTATGSATTACPICGTATEPPFIRIPDVPVHCNVLWTSADDARAAPRGDLDLVFCSTCGHVHNAAFDDARTTYGATYENSLHHSAVFQTYAGELVGELVERYGVRDSDIVEIGAGQGDFLEMLCAAGSNRGTGFDPSFVDADTERSDIRLVPAFYGEEHAEHPADVILCRHVLEHIGPAGDFVAMVRRVIGDRSGTLVVFEVPNADWTFRDGGIWDLIYEHCGYFSEPSLRAAFRRNQFAVERVDSVFGGQFLVLIGRPAPATDSSHEPDRDAVSALSDDIATFARAYEERVTAWNQRFRELADAGLRAVIWGAGSKGVMFLNSVDTAGVVDRAVDINPRKRGMHIAGTGQVIVSPDDLRGDRPDVVVVMNPNYRDEIAATLAGLGITADLLVP